MKDWHKNLGTVLGSAVGALVISVWQTYGVELEAKRLAEESVAEAEQRAEEANQRADEAELRLNEHRDTNADSYELLSKALNALRDQVNEIDEDVWNCVEMIPITEMLRDDAVRRMGARTVEIRTESFYDPETIQRNKAGTDEEPSPNDEINKLIEELANKREKSKPTSKKIKSVEIFQIPPGLSFYEE